LSRAAAPGLTMTLEGYFVPGVLENEQVHHSLDAVEMTKFDSVIVLLNP
jgi:hypothetical protein